jgi:fatty acid desaturase
VNSGNLDHRGFGDIDTLTVREFLALPRWRQLLYPLYRHPIVMFGVGPAYLFILRHRLPAGLMRSSWQFWLSAIATNLAIATLAAAMIWLVGIGPSLLVQLPITIAHAVTASPLNPLGIKGAGEAGAIPVGPLFAQAIENALGLGKRRPSSTKFSLSPNRLFKADHQITTIWST